MKLFSKGGICFGFSLIIGALLNASFVTNIFDFEHWIYFLGISISKFDIIGSFATGLVFTFRGMSQIFFDRIFNRKNSLSIQILLIMMICIGTYIFSDPIIVWACVSAFAVSLTIDMLVFTYCKSSIGWRLILSTILASFSDIYVYNNIANDSGFIFPIGLSTIFFILKTCTSVIVGLLIERRKIISKLMGASII